MPYIIFSASVIAFACVCLWCRKVKKQDAEIFNQKLYDDEFLNLN